MNPESFKQELANKNIKLSQKQMDQFALYAELLVEWNQKINLTAIEDEEGIYLKHFWDSLTLCRAIDMSSVQTLCDIGSGAGFPSLPLKIIFPHLNITIIDSLKKRIKFLDLLVNELGLEDVRLIHGRAEDVGQDDAYRASFDLVTARAVARMNVLSEYCLPLVKKEGLFIAMKGERGEEELDEAERAIKKLGGQLEDHLHFELPFDGGERYLIKIRKIKNTPGKYPRQAGKPSKKPL